MIVWITGLSGAGKTTLAVDVHRILKEGERPVILLDGDELRSVFNEPGQNNRDFDRDARMRLGLRYGRLCKMLAQQNLSIVIATISLFKEVHVWNKENLEDYYQVYLNVPKEELRGRDPKGIYRRFDQGEIANVAGLDLDIDEPNSADWAPEFDPQRSSVALAEELVQRLKERNLF